MPKPDKIVNKKINNVDVTWKKKDEDNLKDLFDVSMEEEIGKITKKKQSPQILENVPEEFMNGDKKVLLEG